MISRKQFLSAIGALALVAATTVTALAADPVSASTDVAIVVSSTGVLSVLMAESTPFADVNYSFSAQQDQGQLTVSVTDLRGTAAGWTFNLRATGDLVGANTADSIPIGGLLFSFIRLRLIAGNTSTLEIHGSTNLHVSTTGQQIASAPVGYGDGEYDIDYFGDLLIPGLTLVDTYTTTLIVEAAAGP